MRKSHLCRGMHLKVTESRMAVMPRPQHSDLISLEALSQVHVTILPLDSATSQDVRLDISVALPANMPIF